MNPQADEYFISHRLFKSAIFIFQLNCLLNGCKFRSIHLECLKQKERYDKIKTNQFFMVVPKHFSAEKRNKKKIIRRDLVSHEILGNKKQNKTFILITSFVKGENVPQCTSNHCISKSQLFLHNQSQKKINNFSQCFE